MRIGRLARWVVAGSLVLGFSAAAAAPGIPPSTLPAQALPDPDRASIQVERTRELIDRARERVQSCDRPRARMWIRSAVQMQERAEAALHDRRPLAALQLTLTARARALRALRLCNMEEDVREAAAQAVRRTARVLSRAHETMTRPDARARELLDEADRLQRQARVELEEERFEAALRLTQAARILVYRAVRGAGPGI